MNLLSKIDQIIFGDEGYIEDPNIPSKKVWTETFSSKEFNIYDWEFKAADTPIKAFYKMPFLLSLITNSDDTYLRDEIVGHRYKYFTKMIDYECFMVIRNLFQAIKHNEEVYTKKLLVLIRFYLFETKVLENKYYDHFLYACYNETSQNNFEIDLYEYDNEVPACNYLINTYMRYALANLHDSIIEILGLNHNTNHRSNALSSMLSNKITKNQYVYIVFSAIKVDDTLSSKNIRKIELAYSQLKDLYYEHIEEGTQMDSRIIECLKKIERKLFTEKLLLTRIEWKKRDNDDVIWLLKRDEENLKQLSSLLDEGNKLSGLDDKEIIKLIWAKTNSLSLAGESWLYILSFLEYNRHEPFIDQGEIDDLDDHQACNRLIDAIIERKSLFKTKNEKLYFLHNYLQNIATTLNDRNIEGEVIFPTSLPRLIYFKLSDLYELERSKADQEIEEMERGMIKPIKMNMSVSDLALLFRALHHVDAIDANSKKQLFSSVSQIFTTTAKEGQKISENSFKNNFNEPNLNSHQYWSVKLKKMLAFILEYN